LCDTLAIYGLSLRWNSWTVDSMKMILVCDHTCLKCWLNSQNNLCLYNPRIASVESHMFMLAECSLRKKMATTQTHYFIFIEIIVKRQMTVKWICDASTLYYQTVSKKVYFVSQNCDKCKHTLASMSKHVTFVLLQ